MAYYPGYMPTSGQCHRYPGGRQPYVRITLEDGSTVDGQAHAWEGNKFLANWFDEKNNLHSLWMDSQHAVKIPWRESRWHESSSADDIIWRIEQGEM
ncbi:hypothetical protein ACSYDW_01430 [Paeniglutamicibacter sp. R2-26]|uniref:hypothetical protein n=1 Tax=Paeniglutamicibacter sp. R2-26 TaxID=3144417 RepID=UPI003EE670C7